MGALIITFTGGAALALITSIAALQYILGFSIGALLGGLAYKAVSTLFSPIKPNDNFYNRHHKQLGAIGLFLGLMLTAIFGAATLGTGYLLVLGMVSAGIVGSYVPYLCKQLVKGLFALGILLSRCCGFNPNNTNNELPPPPADDAENQRQALLRPIYHAKRLEAEGKQVQSRFSQSERKSSQASATTVRESQSASTSEKSAGFRPTSGNPAFSQRRSFEAGSTEPSAPPADTVNPSPA